MAQTDQQKELFRYGFIATAKLTPEVSILKQPRPICAAYVSIDPSNIELLLLDYLIFFNYNPEKVARNLLKIAAKSVWIDSYNASWLAPEWEKESVRLRAEPKEPLKYTLAELQIATREEDRLIRQWKALQLPIQENRLSFAKDISKEDKQAIKTPGDQAAPDAVAGAVEVCALRQEYIKALATINPKVPKRWFGIPRWNEERRQNE